MGTKIRFFAAAHWLLMVACFIIASSSKNENTCLVFSIGSFIFVASFMLSMQLLETKSPDDQAGTVVDGKVDN